MTSHKLYQCIAVPLISILLLSVSISSALADVPFNDDFDTATVIDELPFTTTQDTSEATVAGDDPTTCTNNGSVWYAFTPDVDVTIEANTIDSTYDTVLSAYTGTRNALQHVDGACNDNYYGLQSRIRFDATAGTTYYFLIGFCCGHGQDGGGNLVFTVQEVVPPPAPVNDNFANAMQSPLLPFVDSVDVSGATLEPEEPLPSCADPSWLTGSIWYAFTPSTSQSLAAFAHGPFSTFLAVYTGSTLGELTEMRCSAFYGSAAFQAEAGTTYYIQTGGLFNQEGTLHFSLDVAPPPQAYFYYYPYQPSRFDTIWFQGDAYDPVGAGIESYEWDFGDGSTATGSYLSHKYATDGSYQVSLKVTTYDGRTASTVQQVTVETHDVAITKFSTPQSASVGQTRQIVVGVNSKLHPETVEVQLYKSEPGGYNHYQLVGVLTQYVPVRSGNRTTDFSFNYTFSPEDGSIGKVTFKAVATILSWPDALPADNEAISSPVKVNSRTTKSGDIETATTVEVLQVEEEVAAPEVAQEPITPQTPAVPQEPDTPQAPEAMVELDALHAPDEVSTPGTVQPNETIFLPLIGNQQ